LISLDSDLHPSIHLCMTRSSSMGSPASPASTDSRRTSILRPTTNAWPTRAWGSFSLSGTRWLRSLPLPSSTKTFDGSNRPRHFPLMRGHHLAARGSHTPSVTVPTPPSSTASVYLLSMFFCLCVCFWAFLLLLLLIYPCFGVWVLVTLYASQITFIGDPDFFGIRATNHWARNFGSIAPTYFHS